MRPRSASTSLQFVEQHRFEQGNLAGEMRVKRFFAHAEIRRQIIHGDNAKPVGEKMTPGVCDDPAANRLSRQGPVRNVHYSNLIYGRS